MKTSNHYMNICDKFAGQQNNIDTVKVKKTAEKCTTLQMKSSMFTEILKPERLIMTINL
jgi:hypothetical protein